MDAVPNSIAKNSTTTCDIFSSDFRKNLNPTLFNFDFVDYLIPFTSTDDADILPVDNATNVNITNTSSKTK
jgi:hypothetical protein